MKIKKIITLFFFMIISSAAHAVDPYLNWNTIESDHFYIHYANGYERLAQKTANAAEQAHKKLQFKLNWQPDDKTHLIVSDESDSANGYATPIYFNRSVLFMAPPDSVSSLEDFDDWLETLITHEYTHILHLDKASGVPAGLRKIFGRHFLLFPNLFQPNWFTEGLATYYETDLDKGIGRGQSSLYKMMMRAELEGGIKPVSQVNLPMLSWPRGTASYLYGVNFYQFIDDSYGEQYVNLLSDNYSNNLIPFMINTNTRELFAKDINELWDEYSLWLKKKYPQDVKAERVEGKKITNLGYNTGPLDLTDNKTLYYIANSAFEHAALIKVQNGRQQFVSEVHRGARLNVHPESGVLLTQMEYCDEYNLNMDIYIIATDKDGQFKGEPRALTECGRYRSASWSADGQSIYAVKTDKAKSQLVLLNKKAELLKVLWKGNNTDILTQIKSSPQGDKIIAAVFRKDHGWNIEEFNLASASWHAITDDSAIDMSPAYTDAGDSVLFSSDRSGKYQIYKYTSGQNQLKQITRVSSGAFNPVQFNSQSTLYYRGYNEDGYDLYEMSRTNDLQSEEIKRENKNITLAAAKIKITEAKQYSALSSIYPRWWFPYLSLGNDRNEYGISTAGADALGIHNYFLNFAYDTSNKWLVGDISYAFANNFSIGYRRSTDILRDQNGEFAVARNVDDLYLSVALNKPAIESSVSYRMGMQLSASSEGYRAPGVPKQPDLNDGLLGAAVLYNNSKRYIRSISKNDGRSIRLLAETTEVFESDYSGEIYTLDWREYIRTGEQQVLAIRFVQGWGTESPDPFRLGGENNEYAILDFINPLSESLFGKRQYALRGYAEGLPQLIDRRMQLATAEWRFPGSLIERGFMAPPAGIIQWSGSMFAETGAAYYGSSPDKYYSAAGVELQADINLFYGLTSRMRLGFARGFDSQIGEDRVYFNIGASF